MLKKLFHYIIVDTSHAFDDINLKAMDESEHIFLVSQFDVPSIFNTKRCLNVFNKIGYNKDKVRLVINRYTLFEDIDLAAMEKLIDYPIYWKIPNEDLKHITTSINKGVPICEMMPHSKLSQNFLKMTKQFNGHISKEEIIKNQSKKKPMIKKSSK